MLRSIYPELDVKSEYEINSILVVDIFIEKFNLVIEVNGPSHYIFGTAAFNHKTVVKSGLISDMGYKLLYVKYDDWYNIRANTDKRRFLMDLFEKVMLLGII